MSGLLPFHCHKPQSRQFQIRSRELYSITSSARAKSEGGIVIPSVLLAGARLMLLIGVGTCRCDRV
jgi:hypothetical protein